MSVDERDENYGVASRHGAMSLRVFGSVARGDVRSDSDIDLLVALAEGRSLLDLIGIEQDLEDPGAQRRPALEPVDPVDHREPGVLDDLLGDRTAGHVGQRHPHQRRAELVDERRERRLVTGAQRLDQRRVLGP